MNKKIITITGLVLSIILISLLVVRTTYSLIVDVTSKNGKVEANDRITIRDIVTNDLGEYNNYYYDCISELNITDEEANILIESDELNDVANELLNNVIEYRYNDKLRLTNNEIIDLIITAVNSDSSINNDLKDKVINKTREYINDISNYLYNDIETNLIGSNA